jgi:hypothetical protein
MARTHSLSIGLALLLGCAAAPKAKQAPRAEQNVARPAEAASAATKVFESPDGDFQLQYPASWELEPSTPDLKFHARALFGLVSANVTTEQLRPGTTLDAFVDNDLAQVTNTMELKAPVERTTITVGGTPAVRLGVVARMPPSMNVAVDVHFDVLAAVVNGKGYALTCTTGNSAVAIMKPVFDRIIASMRFTK